jgi:hypothetical protein
MYKMVEKVIINQEVRKFFLFNGGGTNPSIVEKQRFWKFKKQFEYSEKEMKIHVHFAHLLCGWSLSFSEEV